MQKSKTCLPIGKIKNTNKNEKILLHVCCGVCASHTIARLQNENYDVTTYFSNANIHPLAEYKKRKKAMEKVAKFHQVDFLEDEYNHLSWLEKVSGFEKEGEGGKRCPICYRMRLNRTASRAKELNRDLFASTLSISPHKKAEIINEIGRQEGKKYGVKFYEADFKKQDGFKKTCQLADKLKIYRQNYCGCEFSIDK